MAGKHLFSVEAKHDFVRLPHFGPFNSAAEAGQAVDALLARYDDLTVLMHVLNLEQVEDAEVKYQDCIYQLECACSDSSLLYVVEPLMHVDAMPSATEAGVLANDHGIYATDIGYLKTDSGFALLRIHMATADLQKAMTAVRWRRREIEGLSPQAEVVIITTPIPVLSNS